MLSEQILKRDALGVVKLRRDSGRLSVTREPGAARPGLRWLAARLASNEARALQRIGPQAGFPRLLSFDGRVLVRTYLPGDPMYVSPPRSRRYFREALRLLVALHRAGLVHNDLAKEANWISMPDGRPGVVDFQLAIAFSRRGPLFRMLAREDLRHLLKHKRYYHPDTLTARQRALLAQPSWPARLWRALVKPPYHFITRVVLGWPERPGAEERGTGVRR